jgi:ribosomal protein L11 methyltransferase
VERRDTLGATPGALIDAGCGSGVLAIAAHHLGFAPVVAIDTDPIACTTARHNAATNDTEPVWVVDGDLAATPLSPAPTVVANLTAGAILALLPTLLGLVADNGRLMLAGILAEREVEVTAALDEAGWQIEERLERDGWVAMTARGIRRSTQIDTDLLR